MLRAVPPCRFGPFPVIGLAGLRAILLYFSTLASYLCPGCQRTDTLSSIPRAWRGPGRSNWHRGAGTLLRWIHSWIPEEGWDQPHAVPAGNGYCCVGRVEGLLYVLPWVEIWFLTAFLCSPSLLSTANPGACKAGLELGLVMSSTDRAV